MAGNGCQLVSAIASRLTRIPAELVADFLIDLWKLDNWDAMMRLRGDIERPLYTWERRMRRLAFANGVPGYGKYINYSTFALQVRPRRGLLMNMNLRVNL